MKPCEEYFESIIEYAHGDGAELSSEQRAALEAHLGECEACRTELKSAQEFLAVVRPSADTLVPVEVATDLHSRVKTAISRRRVARFRFAASVILAATVALVAASFTFFAHPHKNNSEASRMGVAPSSPKGSAGSYLVEEPKRDKPELPSTDEEPPDAPDPLLPAFERASNATDALRLLEARLSAMLGKDHTREELAQAKNLICRLATRWPDTPEALETTRLLSWCLLEDGQVPEAQRKFLEYAEATGERFKAQLLASSSPRLVARAELGASNTAAMKIAGEARRLYGAGDHSIVLSYCDVVSARYPDVPAARDALQLTARVLVETGNTAEARRIYTRLIEEAPHSDEAAQSIPWLAMILSNENRKKEAANLWLDQAKRVHGELEARALYHAGYYLLDAEDARQYVEGLRLLRDVMKRFPSSDYARLAHKQISNASGLSNLLEEALPGIQ